ncbi:unnamed protein product [Symbiodinium natans]|uniref:Proteasome assembly chaperone 3 n=1 Tax=Symbiodinium natans TaxID=878477 RepID=A0A812I375_9DINO|nr:unnamed protein product [Symbiodinium natans]
MAPGPELLPPAETPGKLMTFYLYRVDNDQRYKLNGVNMANLLGDIWYLHNEVVFNCPRKFNMTRLTRFKVTYRATKELWGQNKNFDAFVAFDKAKCTVPGCPMLHWLPLGYVIGCTKNDVGRVALPGEAAWFSLPGTCPSKFYFQKTAECEKREPGGQCKGSEVTGESDCTYKVEEAGEIRLDELSGIKNYNEVCESTGVREYDELTDKGTGTSFWNGKADAKKGEERVKFISDLFAKRFPKFPAHLDDPPCDLGSLVTGYGGFQQRKLQQQSLGDPDTAHTSETWVNPWPLALDMPGSARCVRLACGAKHTLFLTASGELYGCGQNAQRQLSSAVSGCVTTTELPFSHENGLPVDIFCHPSLNVSVVLTRENRFFICGEAGSLFHTAGLIEQFLPYDRDAIIIENRVVCMKSSAGQVYIPGFNDPKVSAVELVAAQEAQEPESDSAYATRLLERHLGMDSLRRLTQQALQGGTLSSQDVIGEYAGTAPAGLSTGVSSAKEVEIQGTPTSFVITDYGSELFFLITQNAKIGSLIQATASAPNSGDMADMGGLARGERTYDVQVLFGDRRAEHYRAIARSLIEVVAQKSSKPILLGIHLKEHNVEIFRAILQQLREKIAPVVAAEEVDEFADYEGQGS